EPGAIRSERRDPPQRPAIAIPAYDGPRRRTLEVITGGDRTGSDVAAVAERVVRIVGSRAPKLRYRVGNDATWLPRLKLASWRLFERGIRWRYRLDDEE